MSAAAAFKHVSPGKLTAKQKGWFEEAWGGTVKFLKGDLDGPVGILLDTALGMVPVAGQLIDARDIILALVAISAAPQNPAAWFDFITALIGVIPGGGDAVKRGLRAIKKGAMAPQTLFAMLRKAGVGNPEKLLDEVLDLGKIQKQADTLLAGLQNNALLKALPDDTAKEVLDSVKTIRQNLSKQFAAIQDEVNVWLKKQPNSTAKAPVADAKAPKSKPGGKDKGADTPDKGQPNHTNNFDKAAEPWRKLNDGLAAVLGEHIADYHCIENKGWGATFKAHDWENGKTVWVDKHKKLNDNERPIWLATPKLRGPGIDSLWLTNRPAPKQYAVVEAKASISPTTKLYNLLGSAKDKDAKPAKAVRNRGGTAKKGSSSANLVMQMSRTWVEQRLEESFPAYARKILNGAPGRQINYSRHVFVISAFEGYEHAEVLLSLAKEGLMGNPGAANKHAHKHATHKVAKEYGEADLDTAEKEFKNKGPSKGSRKPKGGKK